MKLIHWLSIAFAAFTVVLTIVFFSWWIMKDRIVFGSDKFDQVKWMQAASTIQTECKRGDMAYDLQQHTLAIGSPREAVAVLLGRPSYEDAHSVEYDLGKCMHVYHGLLIYFDENNRLSNSRISSH
jgi:outer membrane protein assembly factor BamE (lipoprotein component of BamABCDE complex)